MNFSCLRYIKSSSTVDISKLLESKHQVVVAESIHATK